MKNLLLAPCAIFGLAAFALTFTGSPALAQSCTTKSADSACKAAAMASLAPDYMGPRAPTIKEMVCLHALAYEPTELVLVDGEVEENAPVDRPVLLRWRVNAHQWRPWERDPSLSIREICFPRTFLKQGASFRGALTLCNGVNYNQPHRGRSVWRSAKGHLQHLWSKRRVAENDPACLLGQGACAKYGL